MASIHSWPLFRQLINIFNIKLDKTVVSVHYILYYKYYLCFNELSIFPIYLT